MFSGVERAAVEVLQDVRKSYRNSENTSEARIGWFEKHESAVEEIKYVERKIQEVEIEQFKRRKRIEEENIPEQPSKITKQSVTSNLEPELVKKYALLEPKDFFPDIYINEDKVSINEVAKERWKKKQPIASGSFSSKPKILKRTKNKFSRTKNNALENRNLNQEKPQKSIIKIEILKTILVAEPAMIEFLNFEKRRTYKRIVLIKNVSNDVAKFQLEPISSRSKFSIVLQSRSGDRENLAPGIHSKMIITFKSEDLEDCEERFVVKVQFGRSISVFARAYRDPPILKGMSVCSMLDYRKARGFDIGDNVSLIETCGSCEYSSEDSSKELDSNSSDTSESNYVAKEPSTICGTLSFAHFDCKKCFVGERIQIATRLKNIGGDGRFFVMSEIDWNSMSIDDVTTKNLILLTCFAFWPVFFSLKRAEEIEFLTYFFPDSHGVQVDKLYIICDNFAVVPIELVGDGFIYDRDFITMGENIEENSWFENREEETCDYSLDLGVSIPNGYLKTTITLTNSSGIEIHCHWEKRSTDETEKRNRVQTWKDFPLELLSVKPTSGIFRPYSSIIFKIFAEMTDLTGELYRAVLQLILEDIPSKAIPKEYENRTEICRNKRRFCEASMDLRDKEIELWIRCNENPIKTQNSKNSYDANVDHHSPEFPIHQSISL